MPGRPHATRRSKSPPDAPGGGTGRVLVVAPEPFYEDRGTPIATRHLLEALSELGHTVDVLTYPVGVDLDIPNVRYCRVGNPLGFKSVPVGLSFRKVFLDVLLSIRLYRQVRRHAYVRIQAIEEMAFAAVVLGRRLPVVYDMASSLPEELRRSPVLGLPPVQFLLRAAESWLLSRVDRVVCSAGLADRIRASGKTVAIDEWHFPGAAPPASPQQIAELRNELELPPDARVVLYGGTFEPYQGLTDLLAAAPRVLEEEPRAIFVLVGARDAEEMASFDRFLRPGIRERVRIVPRQPRTQISRYHEIADVLVSPRSGGDNAPLKIFDYMAAGKPIVATDIPAHRRILDERLALLVPGKPDAIANGIVALFREPDRAARLGAAAREYAEERLGWARFVAKVRVIHAPTVGGDGTVAEREDAGDRVRAS